MDDIQGSGAYSPIIRKRLKFQFQLITFILILFNFIPTDGSRSLGSCPDRHDWVKSINPRRTLVLGVFFPGEELLPSLWPAVDMAKRDIRRDKCVLTHYDLDVSASDTGCKASKGMKALFAMMHDWPKKVALFGAACTSVNEPVASAAKYWNITQLSYFETHPKFSMGAGSQEMYRSFYRIVPGVGNEQTAKIAFVKRFNWTRFGLIVQKDEERYNLPHERYLNVLEKNHFIIASSTGFSSKKPNYNLALSKHKNESARIIIGDFDMAYIGAIFCEAYKQNLTGARHVWILSGNHTRISLSKAAEGHCKPEELQTALQGHFIFEFATIRMDNPKQGYLKNVEVYKKEYEQLCKQKRGCDVNNPFHAYAYDGIWALALSIDAAIQQQLDQEGKFFDPSIDLSDYAKWSKRLATALESNTFEGITGRVQFEKFTNDRLGRVRIAQYRNNDYVVVGEYDTTTNSLTLYDEQNLFFSTTDGLPPPDAVRREHQMEYLDFAIFCVMCALTSFGIILALCFLGVNVYFRNHRFIKMSSPNMNNLIIGGSLLTYVSVVLLGIDTRMADETTYNVMCTTKIGILSVGFSLAFGSMFSKTWRVHSIFTNIKLNKKAIKDYKLFLLVFALFCIDSIILAVWIFVSPLSRHEEVLSNVSSPEMNLVITRQREYCAGDHMSIFQGLLFGYKGILLILGCFLAWETRHVNVPALNDSKYIGMSVYNVVLMCALGVAILFILESNVNASYVLVSLFIIFCTTLTLCLVFVPKIVELARNPKGATGDRRYRQAMMKSVGTDRKLSESDQAHKEQLVRSEQDNQVWRKMMEEKTKEIAELLKHLQAYGDAPMELTSLAKENTSQFSHSSVPDDPFGGVYLGPSGPSFAQKQQQYQQQQQQQQPSAQTIQSPCLPTSPILEDASETTSLLQRPTIGSIREKLSKLRTSWSRQSMPVSCGVDVTGIIVSQTFPGDGLTTSTSFYQSLHELRPLTDVSEAVGSSAPGVISCENDAVPLDTSTSSDYTDEEFDEECATSSGGGSFRRPRPLQYADPSIVETLDTNTEGTSTSGVNNVPSSIRESCLNASTTVQRRRPWSLTVPCIRRNLYAESRAISIIESDNEYQSAVSSLRSSLLYMSILDENDYGAITEETWLTPTDESQTPMQQTQHGSTGRHVTYGSIRVAPPSSFDIWNEEATSDSSKIDRDMGGHTVDVPKRNLRAQSKVTSWRRGPMSWWKRKKSSKEKRRNSSPKIRRGIGDRGVPEIDRGYRGSGMDDIDMESQFQQQQQMLTARGFPNTSPLVAGTKDFKLFSEYVKRK